MIIENAIVTVAPETAAEFERAVAECVEIFRAAAGCEGMALVRIADLPGTYRLLVKWATKEHHAPMFWESPGFKQWRVRVAHYFITTPVLEYNEPICEYF